MARWLLPVRIGALLMTGAVVARCSGGLRDPTSDRDRDGLDDRLEASLAATHLPRIHEFASREASEDCTGPRTRPILYRARPRIVNGRIDRAYVAVTYVLLYAEDCGALGHAGDDEGFTVFLHHDEHPDEWRVLGASAVAHLGAAGERGSRGSGRAIWVSRNKHSNYATFEACDDSDAPADECTADGPSPPGFVLLNVGEPWAQVHNDVGEVMLAAGANPLEARLAAPWYGNPPDDRGEGRLVDAIRTSAASAREQINLAYLLFRGHTIWDRERFLGAGYIVDELFLRSPASAVPGGLAWDAEGPAEPTEHP